MSYYSPRGGNTNLLTMQSRRQLQVAEYIKRSFSQVLQAEGTYIYGDEPLVTVTSVKLSPDFGVASVYLSIYNTENKLGVIQEMQEEMPQLRRLLGNRVRKHVRRVPKLQFYLDDTLDEIDRLDDLLRNMNNPKDTI